MSLCKYLCVLALFAAASAAESVVPPINCAVVLCALPECAEDETTVVPKGQCCPICVPNKPDCSDAICPQILCVAGYHPVTLEGDCCDTCVPVEPDCSLVDCALPVCKIGEIVVTPDGACCPICVPDPNGPSCAAVSCIIPKCRPGEVSIVPEGECCPVCVCEIAGQTFSDCASACPQTCEHPNIVCRARCRPGCECKKGFVIDPINKVCTTVDECPDELCPVKGQVFSSCAGCGTTCARIINDEILFCPAVCREGCTCPGGQVVDTANNECVEPDECPNPCATRFCPSGSRCKIYEPTGESFCEPSCDINNGGCSANQICSLNVVQCIRAPCPPQVVCTDPAEVCGLSPEAGPCKAYFPRYFHNATSGQCEKFIYGGCQGNGNNFKTLEACREQCVCNFPPEVGLCDGVFPRYFYNGTSEQCEGFTYGGCGGNSNNFETLSECNNVCSDVCSLPPKTGPCRAYFRRYYYHSKSGKCRKFVYGGCQGNANNFNTLEDCQDACVEDPCATRICPSGSKCKIYEPTGESFCEPSCDIDNGGCLANQICSLNVVQCIRAPCPPEVVCTDPADVCGLSPEAGPCEAYFPRYFHNATSGQCEKFIYGGCQGNGNNFETLEACRDQCVCGLPPETGLCKAAIPRYFYNSTSEQCEGFTYGGCGGNSNNFETLSECNNVCSDVCSLPAVSGPCLAYFPRYYYNSNSGQCEKFVYGGCQGNANNFKTLEDCQDACAEESTEPPTISPCATIECANGYRCEVFEGKGYCRADCNINNGGCSPEQTCRLQDVVCVKAPCFPVRVCEDPPTCPPTCGEETCAGQHPLTQCSSPGPFEIPGCTGSCKLSYCGACYVRAANTTLEPPSGLDQCRACENPATEYSSNTACYRRWARCAWRRHRKQFGPVDFDDIPASSSVECYIPPGCPFIG